MIHLIASIGCSTMIVLLFRGFSQYRIHSFQAIVVNYLVCLCIGLAASPYEELRNVGNWHGLYLAIGLGTLFISLFYLIARTTQLIGVTVASVAQKLSFVIPVIAGIVIFQEAFTMRKLLGFLIAIAAVLFVSLRKDGGIPKGKLLLMPIIVFAGSGICDLIIKIVEIGYLDQFSNSTFTVVVFAASFSLGAAVMTAGLVNRREYPDPKSLLAGLVLGIPNYGSIYFLIAALQHSGLGASELFPVNNVGVILASAVSAWLIFREHLSNLQWIGLLLALSAILILL